MRRRQLFEIEDQSWFPSFWRDFMTDFLSTACRVFDLFAPATDIILDVVQRSGARGIVDLASGGGGAWPLLLPRLREHCSDLSLTLTDLYPNRNTIARVANRSDDGVRYESYPVDARCVPSSLSGVRTMFLSFHHLDSAAAVEVLADAVRNNAPIAIFEAQRRSLRHLAQFSVSPLMVLGLTPLIGPFRWRRLFYTYLVPVVPLAVGWDGLVSVLRTYSCEEMMQMAKLADPRDSFTWTAETVGNGSNTVQYLTGVPRRADVGRSVPMPVTCTRVQ